MIAKNGINWASMGFTVCGKCPDYKGISKVINMSKTRGRNISYTKPYKLWCEILRIDRGQEWSSGELCEEWKRFENFEKWYNNNYYEIPNETMQFSYRLFDAENTYISPETSCFLPLSINKFVCRKRFLKKYFAEFAENHKEFLPRRVYEKLVGEEVKNV